MGIELTSLAVGGEVVGRHDGMAVFAMWGCPGDTAEVEITEVHRSFARGLVRSVISPSPDRVPAPCPHFGDCGGCQLQHLAYPAQLRHKAALVRDALARIAGMPEVEVSETIGMDRPWRYRSRAEYHSHITAAGAFGLGFARHRSHEIIDLTECALQHPVSERVRALVSELVERLAQSPAERERILGIETLVSFASGKGLVTLICDRPPEFLLPLSEDLRQREPEVAGVLVALRRGRTVHRSPAQLVSGESAIEEEVAGGRYRISADSFFQANTAQTARLLDVVRTSAGVTKGDSVVDLYSGVGTLLLPLARAARTAVGIEDSASAADDARANARAWRLRNARTLERRVERILPRLLGRGATADVVVIDPPRKGCGQLVAAHVARLRPRRVVLASCHPATLARDLSAFAELGYPCRRVQPIDMFPQTWHVEAVAVCDRS